MSKSFKVKKGRGACFSPGKGGGCDRFFYGRRYNPKLETNSISVQNLWLSTPYYSVEPEIDEPFYHYDRS